MQAKLSIRHERSWYAFNVIALVFTTLLALISLLPFFIIVVNSFVPNMTILRNGYSLIPKEFSFEAYNALFQGSKALLRSYGVTIGVTIVGTFVGLAMTAVTGFVLANRQFRFRNTVSFWIYFTSIFGGGVVPWYMMYTRFLGMGDSYLALIIPGLMSPFLIILMRTFISSSIPEAVLESAKIDGAGDFTIFLRVVLPMSGPALATIGLFLALGYWNDWYRSSIFLKSPEKYQLQFYLYNMINTARAMATLAQSNANLSIRTLPTESLKMAMAVVATGPVFLFYPFVQKYYVQGITIGAVKG